MFKAFSYPGGSVFRPSHNYYRQQPFRQTFDQAERAEIVHLKRSSAVSLPPSQWRKTQVISAYIPWIQSDGLSASVVNVSPSTTTFVVSCVNSDDWDQPCYPEGGMTVQQISNSIWRATVSYTSNPYMRTYNCEVKQPTVLCHDTYTGPDPVDFGTKSYTFSKTPYPLVTLTITAGFEKLTSMASAGADCDCVGVL